MGMFTGILKILAASSVWKKKRRDCERRYRSLAVGKNIFDDVKKDGLK
jgi:hypothetical protein